MKKICNITRNRLRWDKGIGRECFAEKEEYEVHFVVADNQKDEIKDGIHFHGVKQRKIRIIRGIFILLALYKKAKSIQADLYVLHDPELLLIALFLKKCGKVVFSSHEYYLEEIENAPDVSKWGKFFLKNCFQFLFWAIPRRLNGLILVCSDQQTGCFCPHSFVLSNYAQIKQFPTAFPILDAANCILYVGIIAERRGFSIILKALEECKQNIRLILCGKFESHEFYGRCQKMSAWRKVEYKGYLATESTRILAKDCFASILNFKPHINLNRNFSPIKLYESMAMGLPVIAPNHYSFYREMILQKEPIGICVELNAKSLAEGIDRLYEDKDLCRTLGTNGRRAFEKTYHFEKQINPFLQFLRNL